MSKTGLSKQKQNIMSPYSTRLLCIAPGCLGYVHTAKAVADLSQYVSKHAVPTDYSSRAPNPDILQWSCSRAFCCCCSWDCCLQDAEISYMTNRNNNHWPKEYIYTRVTDMQTSSQLSSSGQTCSGPTVAGPQNWPENLCKYLGS